jgi:hypothetical protein
MTSAPGQLLDRSIFYRHKDANFYPTFAYIIGRAFALVPQVSMRRSTCVEHELLLEIIYGLISTFAVLLFHWNLN